MDLLKLSESAFLMEKMEFGLTRADIELQGILKQTGTNLLSLDDLRN